GNQHAAGNPAQQARAERHDQRVAVDELEHQRAAPDDDGHADHQAEDHQSDLVRGVGHLRRARDGDHVVQAHDEVRYDNGLDSCPYRRAALDVAVRVLFGDQQFHADPQQQQGAYDLQVGNRQQGEREGNQYDAQANGAGGAP